MTKQQIVNLNAINDLVRECYSNSAKHGFHDGEFNFGEKIALIHSELSEALESYRKRGIMEPDDHCPQHPHVAIELADAIIRCFDLAGRLDLDLGRALHDKMVYNVGRPHKHGKLF